MQPGFLTSSRRIHWLAVVIGGHILVLIYLLDSGRHRTRTTARDDGNRMELFFVELPPPADEAPVARPEKPSLARMPPREKPRADTAITMPNQAPTARVDWQREAEEVAKANRERKLQPAPKAFGQQPATPYVKCNRPQLRDFEAADQKAGIGGGIPYVRLGKRCVLALGIPICVFGKLPKSTGVTLEDMRDPRRPESSVPEAENCVP